MKKLISLKIVVSVFILQLNYNFSASFVKNVDINKISFIIFAVGSAIKPIFEKSFWIQDLGELQNQDTIKNNSEVVLKMNNERKYYAISPSDVKSISKNKIKIDEIIKKKKPFLKINKADFTQEEIITIINTLRSQNHGDQKELPILNITADSLRRVLENKCCVAKYLKNKNNRSLAFIKNLILGIPDDELQVIIGNSNHFYKVLNNVTPMQSVLIVANYKIDQELKQAKLTIKKIESNDSRPKTLIQTMKEMDYTINRVKRIKQSKFYKNCLEKKAIENEIKNEIIKRIKFCFDLNFENKNFENNFDNMQGKRNKKEKKECPCCEIYCGCCALQCDFCEEYCKCRRENKNVCPCCAPFDCPCFKVNCVCGFSDYDKFRINLLNNKGYDQLKNKLLKFSLGILIISFDKWLEKKEEEIEESKRKKETLSLKNKIVNIVIPIRKTVRFFLGWEENFQEKYSIL